MNLPAIANDIAQVFGLPDYASAPALAQARILNDINGAIQELQDAGEDFYGREDLSVDLVTGTDRYTLPKSVQTVLEPVRLEDGTPLRKILSRGALLQFGQIFLGQLSATAANDTPTHYFVESTRDTADVTGDDVAIDVYLRPAPDSLSAGTGKLVVPVVKEPTLVTAAQLSSGTATLPIPHKYVEAIFLPIARKNATGSFLFYDKDKKAQIDSDYERALQLLSVSDPRKPKPAESNDAALAMRGGGGQAQPAGAGP